MTVEKYTVFGSTGFIGSYLVEYLKALNKNVISPHRDNLLKYRNLGHAFYCIGLTADFRQKPFETIDAHVCVLKTIIENTNFQSFTYLSSTRLYGNISSSQEDQTLRVNPKNSQDLYNISKILGESICLSCGTRSVKVVRLSNVYGYDTKSNNFLTAIIKDAITKNKILLRSSLESEKDYISINDVVETLPKIAAKGKYNIYNLASGSNTSNRKILEVLRARLKCQTSVEKDSLRIVYPVIDISRVRNEFSFKARNLIDDLPDLLKQYRFGFNQ